MKSRLRWLLAALVVAAAAGGWYALGERNGPEVSYRYVTLDRGPIAQAVSASGTLNPVITVKVGSQVSGQIASLQADFNSIVKKDQVIARLDPSTFEAKVMEARADLGFTKANVTMQQATLGEMQADLRGAEAAFKDADQDFARKAPLWERRVIARSDIDKAMAARDQARAKIDALKAKIKSQKAQIETAKARVQEKTATLRSRELDLDRTIIRSPVDGVVISRDVDIGQTVAASLQAPILFTIAQDLRQMQVEASIDEADIGRIRVGQTVNFTVDAYPTRTFKGRVNQIRKAPTEVSNVVTYKVIIAANNADQALLPGMTANVEIIIGRRPNALRVANAALRFTPPGAVVTASSGSPFGGPGAARNAQRKAQAKARLDAQIKRLTDAVGLDEGQQQAVREIYRDTGDRVRSLLRSGVPRAQLGPDIQKIRAEGDQRIVPLLRPDQAEKFQTILAERAVRETRPGRVWIMGPDGKPKQINVTMGLSDGTVTEIVRSPLKAGDKVMAGIVSAPRS